MPYALKVLDKSGRTVQLSWAKPYDGNSPLKRYIIEFKTSRGSWEHDVDRVIVPGHTNEAQVQQLSPATTYNFRIVAENEIGVSDSSEVVPIITAEEAPSGKPTNIKVEPTSQTSLRVTWKAPQRNEWNGEILGYYVGYKLSSANTSYYFEEVKYSMEEGKEYSLELTNLKTYTQYSVMIQAYNKVGAGPMSDEEKQYTAEGTPNQPPSETMCTTLTSQTIRVSWVSPPLETANGVIKGYKVVYAPSEQWYDDKNKNYKKTASSDTVLHGLKKYTNYTMQVLAMTSGGDGVRSAPIHCQTEQDGKFPLFCFAPSNQTKKMFCAGFMLNFACFLFNSFLFFLHSSGSTNRCQSIGLQCSIDFSFMATTIPAKWHHFTIHRLFA